MKQITQKITALLDAPHHWQTGFQDPASISMEGILFFNKHFTFLLIVIVLFVGWFLACLVYYFVEFNNHYNSKSAFNKNNKKKAVLSEEVICMWLFFFVTAVPFIFYGELFQIPITRLDPAEAFGEATLPGTLAEEGSVGSEPSDGSVSLGEVNAIMIRIDTLAEDLTAKGHCKSHVMDILLDVVDDDFWSLEYCYQLDVLQNYLGVKNSDPSGSSEPELSVSLEEVNAVMTRIYTLAEDLAAKGHCKSHIMDILLNVVDDGFWSLEYREQVELLEDHLVAEEEEVWRGFYRTIGAVAVCSIAAIVVAVVWWYS